MKVTETAREVIALASAIQNYWNTELPKRHPNYPVIAPGEDSGAPPPAEKKLRDLLASLEDDVIYKLALLMYLGRGDFGTDDLVGHYETLKRRLSKPDRAATQMMGKGPLADYLADGIAELNKSGIDVEDLNFTPMNSST